MKSPKFIAFFIAFIFPFLFSNNSGNCYSQVFRNGRLPAKYVSYVDYEINSEFNNGGAIGTIKYRHNQENGFQAITFYDKTNLQNINRIVLNKTESGLKAVANGVDLKLEWDSEGRISAIRNVRGGLYKSHFDTFTFKYNTDENLQRVNTYNSGKLQTVYQCEYEGGNLIALKNTFVFDSSFRVPNLTFTYYKKQIGKGGFQYYNPILGYLYPGNFDKFPLFAVPEYWLGGESEGLIESVTVTDEYQSITYNFTYEHDEEGYMSLMKVEHKGVTSTFRFSYETWN